MYFTQTCTNDTPSTIGIDKIHIRRSDRGEHRNFACFYNFSGVLAIIWWLLTSMEKTFMKIIFSAGKAFVTGICRIGCLQQCIESPLLLPEFFRVFECQQFFRQKCIVWFEFKSWNYCILVDFLRRVPLRNHVYVKVLAPNISKMSYLKRVCSIRIFYRFNAYL